MAYRISGTSGNDTIFGFASDDSIVAGDGADYVLAGTGNDVVEAGTGNDVISAGGGNDSILGGEGRDTIDGDAGNDTLLGEGGDDYISSHQGSDSIDAGSGDDFVLIQNADGSSRDLTIHAGSGDDVVRFGFESGQGATTAAVALGAGLDTVSVEGYRIASGLSPNVVLLSDFTAGPGGDTVDLGPLLAYSSYTGTGNPFASGHVRLIQSGANTLLQVDMDASGTAKAFVTVLTFQNVAPSSFHYENFFLDGRYPAPSGSAAASGLFNGGSSSAQTITGGNGADTLSGAGGADSITGGGLNDVLDGGEGNDTVAGGHGNDVIYGGDGNDVLNGGNQADSILGDGGNDLLSGDQGSDTLNGGAGDDTHIGGDGDDVFFYIDKGNDSVSGGDGDDRIDMSSSSGGGSVRSVTIEGGSGDDVVIFGNNFAAMTEAFVSLGSGIDTISVFNVNRQFGGPIDSIRVSDFVAGAGGDVIDLTPFIGSSNPSSYISYSTYSGGDPFATGYVRLVQAGADTLIQVDPDGIGAGFSFETMLTLSNVNASNLTSSNFIYNGIPVIPSGVVEGRTGGDGADSMAGVIGNDSIVGGAGNDSIRGASGNDLIDGGQGRDSINGEAGDDTLNGGEGGDWIIAADGNDVIDGGDGDDTIDMSSMSYGAARNLTVNAGSGDDRVTWGYSAYAGATTATVGLGAGVDTVEVSSLNRFYDGTTDQVRITDFVAGGGGDVIDLTPLLTYVTSYFGGDPFATGHVRLVQSGSDTLVQLDMDGSGTQSAFATMVTLSNVAAANLGSSNFVYNGTPVIPSGVIEARAGSIGGDSITGFIGNDSIVAGDGNDTVSGGIGDDVIFGDQGRDGLRGGSGSDTLFGGNGDDTLHANGGNDSISGDDGDDFLDTSSTDNASVDRSVTVSGGAGDDVFYNGPESTSGIATISASLGAGIDTVSISTYRLIAGLSANIVRISDFSAGGGGDVIDLRELLLYTDYFSSAPGVNPFASGHIRLQQSGANTLVQIDLDGSGSVSNYVTLITLLNIAPSALTFENFVLDGTNYAPNGSANPAGVFNGGSSANQTINGGNGNDTISGAGGADSIIGAGRNDSLNGGDGNDTILGGHGIDTLSGGNGNDSLSGGSQNDLLYGDADNDVLAGDQGRDTLVGGAGDDTISGGDGDDAIYDGDGSGLINGDAGDDVIDVTTDGGVAANRALTINGGAGDDVVTFGLSSSAAVTTANVALGAGIDTISVSSYRLAVGNTPDNVRVTDFVSGPGGDVVDLDGLVSNYTTYIAGQNPFATGHVRLLQSGADTLVQVDLDGADIASGFVTMLTLVNTTSSILTSSNFTLGGLHVIPGSAVDTMGGTEAADQLQGSIGADSIVGFGGNDLLGGEGGNDFVSGGVGRDTLDGGSGDDVVNGGDGADVLYFASGNDVLTGDDGDDTVTVESDSSASRALTVSGGSGDDLISFEFNYGQSATSARISLGGGVDTIAASTYRLFAGFAPDSIVVTDFEAGSGGDVLDLGPLLQWCPNYAGGDPFASGHLRLLQSGADTLVQVDLDGKGSTNQFVTLVTLQNVNASALIPTNFVNPSAAPPAGPSQPTAGNDVLTGTSAADTIDGLDGNDSISGLEGADSLIGSAGSDTLIGGGGDDTLDGGTGNDSMAGGLGNDTFVVDSSTDIVSEAAGQGVDSVLSSVSYTLSANVENLTLLGGSAVDATGNDLANVLIGNGAANSIVGGAGDDTLRGGLGNDTLIGGDGADTFLFSEAGFGSDVVDAGDGNDVIDATGDGVVFVSGSLTVSAGAGNDSITAVYDSGTHSISAGAGDDYIRTHVNFNGSSSATDAGDGNDVVVVSGSTHLVTLGAGRDLLEVKANPNGLAMSLTVTDFAAGASGDTLDVSSYLALAANYAAGTNPFASGHLVAVQSGVDTVLQFSGTGSGGSYINIAVLQNVTASSLVADNLVPPFSPNLSDAIIGTAGADSLVGTINADTIQGLAGDDTLIGAEGNDTLDGGADNDSLDGGAGTDSMVGGSGNDIYLVDNVNDVVVELAGEGIDVVTATVSYSIGAEVENLTLAGDAAINGTGNDLANVLTGNSAANSLVGAGGSDTLDGGAGADTLAGGAGNDAYVVDNMADVVIEAANEGVDDVQSSVSHTLAANVENLTLTGSVAINGTGNELANVLTGNTAANSLAGGAGNDTIAAGAGNDTLNGGTGNDSLTGGAGNDTYVIDSTNDVIVEVANEGTDLVQSSVSHTLAANVENLTLTGSAVINGTGNGVANVLTGNGAANSLVGGGGNDTLNGGAGVDTLVGGAGNDSYIVDNAADVVTEAANAGIDRITSSVSYTLSANTEYLTLTGNAVINGTGNELANVITGNSAANTLSGGGGDDVINGGGGNDTLRGGAGSDYLVGGAGADYFGFSAIANSDGVNSVDVIADFVSGTDKLDFAGLSSALGITLSFIGSSQFSDNATGQIRFENGSLYVSTNADSAAEMIIDLAGVNSLQAADFIL